MLRSIRIEILNSGREEEFGGVRLYYTPMTESEKSTGRQAPPNTHFDDRLPKYSLWRRMQIPIIAAVVSAGVRLIGCTLRYEILGWQHAERIYAQRRQIIWTFWHCGILGVLYWGRGRGVVVLHSTNFDGQWIGRIIRKFGFGTALGSSTRGGLSGLAELERQLSEGHDVGFTIDGPRGPRFVAKPGPAILARSSGCPIEVFHVGYEHAKALNTWDRLQIPRPFSRVVMIFAPPILVPVDADRELVKAKHAEMQRELERVQSAAGKWFSLSAEEKQRAREIWNA
jgi:lysophospholipid acyltransferase (LPLAT)-like uncharacterized protein